MVVFVFLLFWFWLLVLACIFGRSGFFLLFLPILTCNPPSAEDGARKESNLGDHVYAVVDYGDAYVEPKIVASLRKHLPSVSTIRDPSELPKAKTGEAVNVLHWSAYEKIPFEEVMEQPGSMLSCSYIIR